MYEQVIQTVGNGLQDLRSAGGRGDGSPEYRDVLFPCFNLFFTAAMVLERNRNGHGLRRHRESVYSSFRECMHYKQRSLNLAPSGRVTAHIKSARSVSQLKKVTAWVRTAEISLLDGKSGCGVTACNNTDSSGIIINVSLYYVMTD